MVPISNWQRFRGRRQFLPFKEMKLIGPGKFICAEDDNVQALGVIIIMKDGYQHRTKSRLDGAGFLVAILEPLEHYLGAENFNKLYHPKYINTSFESLMKGTKYLKYTKNEYDKRTTLFGFAFWITIHIIAAPLIYFHEGGNKDFFLYYFQVLFTSLILCLFLTIPVTTRYNNKQMIEKFRFFSLIYEENRAEHIPPKTKALYEELKNKNNTRTKMGANWFNIITPIPIENITQPDTLCPNCNEIYNARVAVYPGQRHTTVFCPNCSHSSIIDLDHEIVRQGFREYARSDIDYNTLISGSRKRGFSVLLEPKKWWNKCVNQTNQEERLATVNANRHRWFYLISFPTGLFITVVIFVIFLDYFKMEISATIFLFILFIFLIVFSGFALRNLLKYEALAELYRQIRIYENNLIDPNLGVKLSQETLENIELDAKIHRKEKEIKVSLLKKNEATIMLDGEDQIVWNLESGKILRAQGVAGQQFASLMNGGMVIIEGDAGAVAGGNMFAGSLLIKGNCGNELGLGIQGGTIIVTGNCGVKTGHWMVGGRILVGGKVASLGMNARFVPLEDEDINTLKDMEIENPDEYQKILPDKISKYSDLPDALKTPIMPPPANE